MLFIISSLTHELTFFFIPFLFLFKFSNFPDLKLNFTNYIFEIICSFAILLTLIIVNTLKVPYGNEICQSLIDLGINNEICNGVIRDFANPNTFDLNLIYNNLKYLSNFNYFSQYSSYIILNYLPIILIFYKSVLDGKINFKFFFIFAVSILFLSPLILLTTDWGRYLNNLFILHILCFHFLIKKTKY